VCNLYLAPPFERWNSIIRFALYTVTTRAPRNAEKVRHTLAPEECSANVPWECRTVLTAI